MEMQKLMEAYNQQALLTFTGKGHANNWSIPTFSNASMLTKDVDTSNQAGLYYSGNGFFVDCCLEAPILNATLQPIYSLANMIPVFPTGNRKVVFGFLTNITDPTGTYPNAPCDDDMEVGDAEFCKAELEVGRISYQTKTIELDALIEKACLGVREDFYLVGSIRGVSAIPNQDQFNDRDFVKRMAVRRQMMLVGRALQRDLLRQFWIGDPTNLAVNTAGGGRKEFWGLDALINDDYATKPFVTGTNCAALNSDVKVATNCLGSGGTPGIYALMQALEQNRYNLAAYAGLLPVTWVWSMHPIIWNELLKYLPCEMMSDSCVRPGYPLADTGTILNVDGGMSQTFMRNQLQTTMQIPVNGRTYDVVLDSSIPIVQGGTLAAPTYTSTIYFIPLQAAGEPTLYWNHKDYRRLEEQLSPIPGSQTDMRGWTDGGRYHHVIEFLRRCFVVSTKMEMNLVFRAPHLAGKITDVCVSPVQVMPNPTI